MDDNTSSHRENARMQLSVKDRLLTKEQAQELLQSVQGIPNEAMLHLALINGVRRGELLGLQWADCDLESSILHVRRTLMVFDEKHSQTFEPKQKREIILTKDLVALLRQHQRAQQIQCEQAGNRWKEQDLLFTNEVGNPLDEHTFTDWLDMVRTKAQLPHLYFHDLRLSYLKQTIGMQESTRTTCLED